MLSLRSTTQLPRHAPPSLSLGSLGHSPRLLLMKASASDFRPSCFPSSGAFRGSASASQTMVSFSRLSVCPRLTGARLSPLLHAMRFVASIFRSQVSRGSAARATVLGRRFAEQSTQSEWPNQRWSEQLRRVTGRAFCEPRLLVIWSRLLRARRWARPAPRLRCR